MKEKYKNNNYLGYMFIGGLLAVTGISGCVLRSTAVSAEGDSVTDTVAITVPVSCTMSGNIDTAHTATINNGIYSGSSGSEYENGIGKTTLTTFCNDQNGFSVYAIGFTNDTAGNTNLAGTAASGNANIATGTATSGSTSNWAMKVNKVDNPVSGDPVTYNPENMTITSDTEGLFSSYHTVPNTYTKVAEYHAVTGSSSTDIGTNALGAKITTTYAAYISPTQPADTYTGQVKYVMVHPYDASVPIGSLCASNQLVMQNVSQWESSVTFGNEVTACDNRDGKAYTVARLADGNLWMTQNLDLDIVTDGSVIYDNTTTDLGWNSSTNSYDDATWAPISSAYTHNSTSEYEWGRYGDEYDISNYSPSDFPESYDPGDLCWDGVIGNSYSGNLTNNATTCTNSNMHYHIGNYYNWTAAVAMSGSSSYITDDEDVDQSICPAGWMLPKGGSNTSSGSFAYLINQANLTAGISGNIHQSPNYFVYGGYWNGSSNIVGDYGIYWSSVEHDDGQAYYLDFSQEGLLSPFSYDNRGDGLSVRCVAR